MTIDLLPIENFFTKLTTKDISAFVTDTERAEYFYIL